MPFLNAKFWFWVRVRTLKFRKASDVQNKLLSIWHFRTFRIVKKSLLAPGVQVDREDSIALTHYMHWQLACFFQVKTPDCNLNLALKSFEVFHNNVWNEVLNLEILQVYFSIPFCTSNVHIKKAHKFQVVWHFQVKLDCKILCHSGMCWNSLSVTQAGRFLVWVQVRILQVRLQVSLT